MPLRIDVVIVQKTREGMPPVPRLLKSILGDLAHDTLVHFKGPSDELERDDARMLLAYAAQYLTVEGFTGCAKVVFEILDSSSSGGRDFTAISEVEVLGPPGS